MADPIVFFPLMTQAGAEAAFNASNDGLELQIDAVAFGTGVYDPDGTETTLQDEVARVGIVGGSRITPNQIRLMSVWNDPDAVATINEIGYWAGDVLVYVWSRTVGGPIGYKTQGVDFALFHDLSFAQVPAESINVLVDPDLNVALAALMAHEIANNAHPQYLLRSGFVDAHSLMTAETVTGSANAVAISLPAESIVVQYNAGQQYVFVAQATNTGPVTVNVNGLGSIEVVKNGVTPLSAGDIIVGSPYTLFFDGARFQLSAGVAGGGSIIKYPYVAQEGQTQFAANYLVGNVIVVKNGRILDEDDFVANDGTTVNLVDPTTAGDVILILAFKSFSVPDAYRREEIDQMFDDFTVTVAKVSDATAAGRAIMQTGALPEAYYMRVNTDGTMSRVLRGAVRSDIGANDASNLNDGIMSSARTPAFTGDVTKPAGSGVQTLANTGVTAGTYGSTTQVPRITFDSKGRATGVTLQTIAQTVPQATLDQVEDGTAIAAYVRPDRMRFGFSINLGTTGHIKFPSWMLGLELRWGVLSALEGQTVNTGDIFSTACLAAFGNIRPGGEANTGSVTPMVWNSGRRVYLRNLDSSDEMAFGYFAIGH